MRKLFDLVNRRKATVASAAGFLALLLFAGIGARLLSESVNADPMTSTITIGSARINFTVDGGHNGPPPAAISEWVRAAAESVTAYYGRFPVEQLAIRIRPFDGNGIRGGRTFGRDGGYISIHVGDETSASEFNSDWMMTHEMIHLAFPSVADEHHWIEEGISTYVEPIARVRAKNHLDEAQMWFELVRDLPQGLPEEGDKGLDHTHTWGRTYWGGALFCFLADLEIRRQTDNRKGLEDALRGILNAGGTISEDWELEKGLDIGDKATGTTVLRSLYEKMKDQPYRVDLAEKWQQLGVVREGDTVRFVDSAPLAASRKAITWGGSAMQNKSASASNLSASVSYPAVIAGRTARVR
jgi:hypothetical protein